MRASSRSFFFCNPSHSLFNFISNPPDLFNRSSFRIVQAPVNQLLLHRCEHRLRTGFLDEQPIVTTSRAPLIMSAVNIFGDLLIRSIPRSLIGSTTTGLTRADGTVPALIAFNPSFSANAWAIWLRPAFSTQTNRIPSCAGRMVTLECRSLPKGLIDPKKRPITRRKIYTSLSALGS